MRLSLCIFIMYALLVRIRFTGISNTYLIDVIPKTYSKFKWFESSFLFFVSFLVNVCIRTGSKSSITATYPYRNSSHIGMIALILLSKVLTCFGLLGCLLLLPIQHPMCVNLTTARKAQSFLLKSL
jgi:hypothetical protein